MAIEYRLNGVLLTDRVRFLDEGDGFVSAAERGALGTCGVIIDDPTNNLTVRGLMPFTVDETEAFPYSRVWTGYVAPDVNSGRIRIQDQTTTSRSFDVDLVDQNELLQRMIFLLNAAKRPTETDVARVTYMLTSEAMTGLVYNNGLVSSSNPGTFLESDLRRRYPNDALAELAPSAVKNFFVYRDNATGQASLFYDKDTSTAYSSSLRISNDPADIDEAAIKNGTAMTYPPVWDARLAEQYDQVFTGVSYGWQGEPIYVTSASIAATYGTTRDAVYDTDRVGVLATAQQAAKDWLNVRAGGEKVLPVTIYVPPSKVNEVYAGQRMQVKFTELTGLTSFTWARVRRRAVKPAGARVWEMRLELYIPQTPVSDAAIPSSAVCATDFLSGVTFTYTVIDNLDTGSGSGPAINNIAGLNDADGNTGAWMATGHVTGPNGTLVYDFRADLGSSQTAASVVAGGYACGGWTFKVYTGASLGAKTTLLATTVFPSSDLVTIEFTSTAARYWTFEMSHYHSGFVYLSGFGGSGNLGLNIYQLCSGVEVPLPETGQQIDDGSATPGVNGTTTSFTATDSNGVAMGYIDGSLIVIVDGIDVWADVTETNAVTGAFTLGFAPESDELVRTRFRSR